MITAETPILSNDLIIKGKCSILPPLSASKIIGFVVTSKISFNPKFLWSNLLIDYLVYLLRLSFG